MRRDELQAKRNPILLEDFRWRTQAFDVEIPIFFEWTLVIPS